MLGKLCYVLCSMILISTDSQIARGVRCEFLPPYSPDYNPIELAFSSMNYFLRCHGDYVRLAMTTMTDHEVYHCLLKALYSISIKDIHGWYKYCSYI